MLSCDDEYYEEYMRRPRSRYWSCSDGFCGADDCPRCRPGNFREGVYIYEEEVEE